MRIYGTGRLVPGLRSDPSGSETMEDHETLCQKKSFEGVGKKDESHKNIVILKDSQVRRARE